jgi:hypothetical protein
LAILASTLDRGLENNRARDGTGSGAWSAVLPPKYRWFTTKDAAKHNNVSTGKKVTCLPCRTGRRTSSIRNCSRAWPAVSSR